MEETKSLKEEIKSRMDKRENKLAIATSIITAASAGDKTALAVLSRLLDDTVASEEEAAFPLTDEEFKHILCLAADRIRTTL